MVPTNPEPNQILKLKVWEATEFVFNEHQDDWDDYPLGLFFKKEDAVECAEIHAGDHADQNNEGLVPPEDREQLLIEEGDDCTWVYVGNPREIAEINRAQGHMTWVYFTASSKMLEVK